MSFFRDYRLESICLFLAALAGFFLCDFDGPLTYQHDLRQSQTALAIHSMLSAGFSLDALALPIFGAEQPIIQFELPLFQAIAAMIGDGFADGENLPVVAVAAGRVVNFAAFLLCGLLTAVLGRKLFDDRVGLLAMLLFYLLPMNVYWAFNVTIEFFALAPALLLLILSLDLADDRPSTKRLLLILVVGTLAALSKITTLLIVGPAIAWLVLRALHRALTKSGFHAWQLAVLAVYAAPLLAAMLWSQWTDGLKADNVFAADFLAMPAFANHVFGPFALKLSSETWSRIAIYWLFMFYGPLLLLVVLAVRDTARRAKVLLLLTPILVAFLVFTNLYFRINYYHLPLTAFASIVIAVGLSRLFARSFAAARGKAVLAGVLAAGLVWWQMAAFNYLTELDFPNDFINAGTGRPLAKHSAFRQATDEGVTLLTKHTLPDQVTLIADDSFTSYFALYGERTVAMARLCGAPIYNDGERLRAAGRLDFFLFRKTRMFCRQLTVPARCATVDTENWRGGTCVEVTAAPPEDS